VIGAISSLVWRKGADIFVQVARIILETAPDTYFIWVGGSPDSYEYKEMVRDIPLMGLGHHVLFVGGKSDLKGHYESFDVFLLTSREDPFPLVCLEAVILGGVAIGDNVVIGANNLIYKPIPSNSIIKAILSFDLKFRQ
jgi:glycosyltransferase involved in cell wall biosynthesis